MGCPAADRPRVTSAFSNETSAEAAAVPPLPVLSVLFARFVSYSAFFFNDTATTEIYALSLHDALPILLAPEARLAMVQGKAVQPPPVTFVMVRLVGVSVT